MYSEKLEKLIQIALKDGELNEKERAVLFKNAEAEGIDFDEFEMVLNDRISEMNPNKTATTTRQWSVVSCNYGEINPNTAEKIVEPKIANRTFIASRFSFGNIIFPPSITVEDGGLTLKFPSLFSGKEKFIEFDDISSISFAAPIVGFTELTLNVRGAITIITGFYKADCKAIMDVWKNRKRAFG